MMGKNKARRDMDTEVIPLCDSLNKLPGIQTYESCCGHGNAPFRIFFDAINRKVLAQVCYAADACHSGIAGWRVIAITDCSMRPASFFLEGPVGEVAYSGAQSISKFINENFQHPRTTGRNEE